MACTTDPTLRRTYTTVTPVAVLVGRLLPEGRIKNLLRRQYFRFSYNPLYPLANIIRSVERTQDGAALLELTNGVKLFGPSDSTFDPSIRYGDSSKLGKISQYEDFYNFFYVVCEQFAHDAYHRVTTLKKGDVVVDLGAHIGAYSVKAALAVGPKGKVIAVEPDEENSRLLRANVKINGLCNVVVLQRGVWNTKGKLKLRMSTTCGSHTLCTDSSDFWETGEFEEVEVNTVDNMLRELRIRNVAFIKMDIEGAEVEALEGMQETLRMNGLKLAIAAYHRREGVETRKIVSRRLKEMGFQVQVRENIIFAQRR